MYFCFIHTQPHIPSTQVNSVYAAHELEQNTPKCTSHRIAMKYLIQFAQMWFVSVEHFESSTLLSYNISSDTKYYTIQWKKYTNHICCAMVVVVVYELWMDAVVDKKKIFNYFSR